MWYLATFIAGFVFAWTYFVLSNAREFLNEEFKKKK